MGGGGGGAGMGGAGMSGAPSGGMGGNGGAPSGGGMDFMGMLGGMMGGSGSTKKAGGVGDPATQSGPQGSQKSDPNDMFNSAVSQYTYGILNFGEGKDTTPPRPAPLQQLPDRLTAQNVYEPLRMIYSS